jgi:hypothetical protein
VTISENLIDFSGLQVLSAAVFNAQRERTSRLRNCHDRLVQKTLDLQSTLADAMRFIPVNLSSAKGSIIEPNRRISFEFSPSSAPMPFPKVLQSVDAAAAGDDLDIRDLPDHLKHRVDRGAPIAGSFDAYQPR